MQIIRMSDDECSTFLRLGAAGCVHHTAAVHALTRVVGGALELRALADVFVLQNLKTVWMITS